MIEVKRKNGSWSVYRDGQQIGYVDRIQRHGLKWQIRIDGVTGAEYHRIADLRFECRWEAEKFICKYHEEN